MHAKATYAANDFIRKLPFGIRGYFRSVRNASGGIRFIIEHISIGEAGRCHRKCNHSQHESGSYFFHNRFLPFSRISVQCVQTAASSVGTFPVHQSFPVFCVHPTQREKKEECSTSHQISQRFTSVEHRKNICIKMIFLAVRCEHAKNFTSTIISRHDGSFTAATDF